MKVDKRELILESMIQAYLRVGEPIGSAELGLLMKEAIPASTIRVYFKKLSDAGAITQIHISGGRIPTELAMRVFWQNKLDFEGTFDVVDGDFLDYLVSEFGLYCLVFKPYDVELKEVLNLQNRFLVLDFGVECIGLKFNRRVEKFLTNLVGSSLVELEEIAAQIGLSELRRKIGEFKNAQVLFRANEDVALKSRCGAYIGETLGPNLAELFGSSVEFSPLFEPGYMGVLADVRFEGVETKMVVVGGIYANYGEFFERLAA